MDKRIKVVDVELGAPPQPLEDLGGYRRLKAVTRLHGAPIGCVDLPLSAAGMTAEGLRRVLLRRLEWPVIRHHLRDVIEKPLPPDGLGFEEMMQARHPACVGDRPLVTVAVCTRDNPRDLRLCLDSLVSLDYPRLDVLVVDNAPGRDDTERLVKDSYTQVRYVREERPGLNWARNRAIAEARGEIIAYTDDDVMVDPGWVGALATAFEDPQVTAVTGLVVPCELETEAQILFERYGGFGRGFERRWWRMDVGERAFRYLGAGKYGTGANMAYRRSVFEGIGPFDPALDVGTVTNGGGDLEMFFRVLREGRTLAYEPAAVVRHRHRRGYAELREQLTNNGVGFYSHLVRTAREYPDARAEALRFGVWWFWWWSLRRLAKSFVRPSYFPRDLILAELRGAVAGLGRYPQARRRATEIAASGGDSPVALPSTARKREPAAKGEDAVGVRTVELCRPVRGLDDVGDYASVQVYVTFDGRPIGSVDIANRNRPVGAAWLREAIVANLGLRMLGRNPARDPYNPSVDEGAALRRRYLPDDEKGTPARLPEDVTVSVVVATYDRPDDLRECLRGLTSQDTYRPVEVLVVDNNPASGVTPPVVEEFPGVRLVSETRRGLAYARNKGFAASRGEIVAATDDDVLVPPGWLEKLVAPFTRPDAMVVTGNILPYELETAAQRHYEEYGGLGRGFAPGEADGEWFGAFRGAVPTWKLGATANAAFRASIFDHPEIGLMDEALGAGTPTGCGEDTYLFYKVLKAGYTIAYQPSAFVWHRHRREMRALRNQLYNYSKGHVAYHLTTLLRDRDPRAARYLTLRLPKVQLKRLASSARKSLLRKGGYPPSLLLLEILGNLAGPWGLWRSRRRVRREEPAFSASGRDATEEDPARF